MEDPNSGPEEIEVEPVENIALEEEWYEKILERASELEEKHRLRERHPYIVSGAVNLYYGTKKLKELYNQL